ncbi:hypothetical protein H8N03_19290 [Ramlibacter sp. USB13]|uniref:Flagellar assembly protein FliH n=1 Tax=Ramlibacter cellulosilyticus TaxID=2764187 RepID=A0A923MTW5_9BURK|nr:FliH/SctL family protein [Ramlibacter cellulosilyticus]MBC5785100.1 hypothetical protein [Ramlibacter cellulosilyticus]
MNALAADILRGMEVERQPLRVGRARTSPATAQPVPAAPVPVPLDPEAIEELRREAQHAGYEEGRRQGLGAAATERAAAVERAVSEALAPLRKQQEQLTSLVEGLSTAMHDCLRAAEDDMVALCFDAVCRMVGEAAPQPEAVRSELRARAVRAASDGGAEIHVHPQDLELLEPQPERGPVRYVADPQVALGGCIVRQAGGGLDARLETMLATFKAVLLSARARRVGEAQS